MSLLRRLRDYQDVRPEGDVGAYADLTRSLIREAADALRSCEKRLSELQRATYSMDMTAIDDED